MKHKTIRLKYEHSAHDIDTLVKNSATASDNDYDLLVTDFCTVLKPNGEVLLKLLPHAINLDYAAAAFHAFAGKELGNVRNSARPAMKTSLNDGLEGVLGFMDRVHRFNFCRATALTNTHLEGFKACLPLIHSANELMRIYAPDQHAAQLEACRNCHSDYVIPSTAFSTITVNRDVTASYHMDKGDYKPGIGVITAAWAKPSPSDWLVVPDNPVAGGDLVFPKFGVGVRLRTGDVVLCDVHEAHGVTPILAKPGSWARMSFVPYLREKMNACGSLAEELAQVSKADTEKYFGKK